jgi:hypothetical protein
MGMGVGTTGGILLGMWLSRPAIANPTMKSVACLMFGKTSVSESFKIPKQFYQQYPPILECNCMQDKSPETDIYIGYFDSC